MTLRIGLDIHGCINTKPEFFAELSKLLVENGHECHVITGSYDKEHIHNELKEYGIEYTHFFSIATHNSNKGVPITHDSKGRPWMDKEIWNKTKGEYCRENNIDLMLDDKIEYADHFTTPFARFFSKHVPKKVREVVVE